VTDDQLDELAKLLVPRLNALADGGITLKEPEPAKPKKPTGKTKLPPEPWEIYQAIRMGIE
jgi:hypothetical protein